LKKAEKSDTKEKKPEAKKANVSGNLQKEISGLKCPRNQRLSSSELVADIPIIYL
jgi:hypothetical protein